jgi:hypothetical protein
MRPVLKEACLLLQVNRSIAFDILLTVADVVGDGPGCKIDIVTDDSGAPRSGEEFRERALSGLVGSQGLDQRRLLKRSGITANGS